MEKGFHKGLFYWHCRWYGSICNRCNFFKRSFFKEYFTALEKQSAKIAAALIPKFTKTYKSLWQKMENNQVMEEKAQLSVFWTEQELFMVVNCYIDGSISPFSTLLLFNNAKWLLVSCFRILLS